MAPKQQPGKSEQSVQTPPEFMSAVRGLLNIDEFYWDLAADEHNTQAKHWCGEEHNSLIQEWAWYSKVEWLWLNPPYGDIGPWVQKCCNESQAGAKIACLVPASVGANWWLHWVDGQAQVYLLNGRITFVGHKSPYPKDLALLLYRPNVTGGYSIWSWK